MSPSEQARWFAEEVKPHEPLLRGYLQKRFPSLPDHDDIVQEAYSRLLRAGSNRQMAATKAFLFTIARNLAIDILRRQKSITHEPISEITEMPLLEEGPDIAETIERRQRNEALVEAIASLPDRCREVVKLRFVDGLPYKEIADRMGIASNTVKNHLVNGMRDCAAFFEKQGLLEEKRDDHSAS